MRSPGVIYRQYRQLRKKIIYDATVQARYREHANCFYGITGSVETPNGQVFSAKLCTYGSDGGRGLSFCSRPDSCNAFINKWTKESVLKDYSEKMNDHTWLKKNHPEILTLEWVLDKNLYEAGKRPSIVVSSLLWLISIMEETIKRLSK